MFLKPLGVQNALVPLTSALRTLGAIEKRRLVACTTDLIERHYAEHAGKEFFPLLTRYYQGQTVLALVLTGDDIVQRVRDAIGPSDPRRAQDWHLRALVLRRFPDGLLGWTKTEQVTGGVDNFIHASDSAEAAEREISLWGM